MQMDILQHDDLPFPRSLPEIQRMFPGTGKLHEAGLIDYRRGHITVIKRPGLETRVCERYSVVKKETDRLLSDICIP